MNEETIYEEMTEEDPDYRSAMMQALAKRVGIILAEDQEGEIDAHRSEYLRPRDSFSWGKQKSVLE